MLHRGFRSGIRVRASVTVWLPSKLVSSVPFVSLVFYHVRRSRGPLNLHCDVLSCFWLLSFHFRHLYSVLLCIVSFVIYFNFFYWIWMDGLALLTCIWILFYQCSCSGRNHSSRESWAKLIAARWGSMVHGDGVKCFSFLWNNQTDACARKRKLYKAVL